MKIQKGKFKLEQLKELEIVKRLKSFSKVKLAMMAVIAILIIVLVYNIVVAVRTGNQLITVNSSKTFYNNSKSSIGITAYDTNRNQLEGTVKAKLVDQNGKVVKGTKTKSELDGNNITNVEMDIPDIEQGNYYLEVEVSSKKGKDKIESTIQILDDDDVNVTTTLDKGIYKPGDVVNFRTLLTSKIEDKPVEDNINISIYDGNDNRVYNEDMKTSEFGIISGKFTLADEVNSGTYKLTVSRGVKQYTTMFNVNPYTVPKFESNINTDKETYLVNDTAKITIDSTYFFGEPVKNADIKIYVDGEEKQTAKTDENGQYVYDYIVSQAKKYEVKVEVTDESNYMVEESKTLVVGTDIFEVELLAENNVLNNNSNNEVYVFTKKADGTPIKAYVTVNAGTVTKQVATDENGIGRFTIQTQKTISSQYRNSKVTEVAEDFKITAQDMENNEVSKTVSIPVTFDGIKVSTNKLKYDIGEDINIGINSDNDSQKEIYVYKNNKLLKSIYLENGETTVNLDNTYGIIDIYVREWNQSSRKYATAKRTIYISPNKNMDIVISTDKEEYKPGENINISFDITANGEKQDTALLVSMLDEAVLNLADNDLSIDNIKLALSDLQFSDELDGATLYSAIAENKSEQIIMGLLLKQESKDIDINSKTYNGYDDEDNAIRNAVICAIILLVIYFIMFFKPIKGRIGNILKAIISIIVIGYIVLMALIQILHNVLNYDNEIIIMILSGMTAIALYTTVLSKYKESIFETSLSLLIGFFIAMLSHGFMDTEIVATIITTVIILIMITLASIIFTSYNKNKLEGNDMFDNFVKIQKNIVKMLIFIILSCIILSVICDGISTIGCFIILTIYLFILNYINIKISNYKELSPYKKIMSASTIEAIIVIAVIFGVFWGVGYLIENSENSLPSLDLAPSSPGSSSQSSSSSSGGAGSLIDNFETSGAGVDTSASSSSSGFGDVIGNLFDSRKDTTTNSVQDQEFAENTTEEIVQTTEVTNKVRNVFLESMCFIPELVAENGTASLPLTLSDNITTWQIQTVGNTKDGTIGYSSKNIKVFKEFFVDFELPTNAYTSDKISIPVTVYNYTENEKNVTLKIRQEDWFELDGISDTINITLGSNQTKLEYIPIRIKNVGDHVFRVEAQSDGSEDIVEKNILVETNGYKKENLVSSGTINKETINEDILFLENTLENSNNKVQVKLYPSAMAQVVNGIENIFKMPSGCFEQVSSSLYPDIVALKYMNDNNIINEELRNKALNYIETGYQKLLTYEVKGEKGGYSLYGSSPAETVLTSYGLMQLNDLSEVYKVDQNVIDNMKDFLYKKQKVDGSFTITGYHFSSVGSRNDLALNAYIIWALSEADPKDGRLEKSINYLSDKIEETTDNYTLALIANALANVDNKDASKATKKILDGLNSDEDVISVTSNVRDYYGSYGNMQTVQTTALTSMALSKLDENQRTNEKLINYIISVKDTRGTWGTTQATVMALKSLIQYNEKEDIENQEIIVKVNDDERKLEIGENALEIYTFTFENLSKENKLSINIPKGKMTYEVVQEYYISYEEAQKQESSIEISMDMPTEMKINETVTSKIILTNVSQSSIDNGMVVINIPQGFSVVTESLELLKTKGIIEKYETNYREIIIYLRQFEQSELKTLEIQLRPSYPVEVTGASVRAYDYYNPTIEGTLMPRSIKVTE